MFTSSLLYTFSGVKSKFNLGGKTGLFQAVRLDPQAIIKKNLFYKFQIKGIYKNTRIFYSLTLIVFMKYKQKSQRRPAPSPHPRRNRFKTFQIFVERFKILKISISTIVYIFNALFVYLLTPESANLMHLSRSQIPPKPVSIERRLKSLNIEYDFKWNQTYLSRSLNLRRGSNSFNSASVLLNYVHCLYTCTSCNTPPTVLCTLWSELMNGEKNYVWPV